MKTITDRTTTNMTKLEILEEVFAEYIENPSLRAIVSTLCNDGIIQNKCAYLTQDGRKCAVGKCLIDGSHQNFNGDVSNLVMKYGLDPILIEKYIGMEIAFWMDLQDLHDTPSYWNETGLSEHGLFKYNKLKEEFSK